MKNKPAKKGLSGIAVALLLFICLCITATRSLTGGDEEPTPTAQAEITTQHGAGQKSTAPTATAYSVVIPTTEAKPQSQPAGIPGIMPADVTVNLEERFGMDCGSPDIQDGTTIRNCNKDNVFVVEIYGNGSFVVDMIDASYASLTPDLETARTLMTFVASIAFIDDTANQQAAMSWVSNNIALASSSKETEIAGIHFSLVNSPTAVILTVGTLK